MRIRREKSIRKTLSFYKLHGGTNFQTPYKIICDGNFIVASFRFKVPIMERLRKIFQGDVFHFYTTPSVIQEMEGLLVQSSSSDNPEHEELFQNALQFLNEECVLLSSEEEEEKEEKQTQTTNKGITKKLKHMNQVSNDIYNLTSSNKNSNGYFIATQEEELRSLLRNLHSIHIPLIYINKTGIILLESPSTSSHTLASNVETHKLSTTILSNEQELVHRIKTQNRKRKQEESKVTQQKQIVEGGMVYNGGRGKKKAKGANPLSCKKKKATVQDCQGGDGTGVKRKRRKNK